jgi:hypothetical protein
MTIDALVAGYPGDLAWGQFASAHRASDEAIVNVVTARLGKDGARWMETPVPALGGWSPKQILADHPKGEHAVRSLIMRIP